MRISDWSSDVCSSDLVTRLGDRGRHRPTRRLSPDRRLEAGAPGAAEGLTSANCHRRSHPYGERASPPVAMLAPVPGVGQARERPYDATRADRKSVVSGKSVSVRVDLGGRRIIKKKKKQQRAMKQRD